MAEPAELLIIKDQYEQALHCLKRGMAAEEADRRPEALEYYRTGRKHLAQGLEVPTGGARHQAGAPCWDTARQLQQKMRETLQNLICHLPELEESVAELTTESSQQGPGGESGDIFYPALEDNILPPPSSLLHLYPSVPALLMTTNPPAQDLLVPTPAPPVRPASPNPSHQGTTTTSLPACWPPEDQPPAYTPRPTDGHHSLAYSPAARGLGLGGAQMLGGSAGGEEGGEELMFIPAGVQLFFVTPDGQVSSLSHPGFLRIISFGCRSKDSSGGRPSAVLHVCDWLYPLTEDTPVLLANSGIFMFPDTMAETPGSYMGIVLSSELPGPDRDLFRDLLSQLAELRIQAPEEGAGSEVINLAEKVPLLPPRPGTPQHVTIATKPGTQQQVTVATAEEEKLPLPEWSEKMSQSILSGATWLSKGFVKGAEATGKVIHRGASKLRDHITPENTPTEVSPRVNKNLQAAKQATAGAVRVSQFLVNGVCTVAGCVGDKLAPHVKKHGAKLIPESMKKSKDGRASNLDAAMVVAASSVQGFSTMWSGLETGAKTVGKSVTSETVRTVKYKYGEEAGNATDTGLASAVNVGLAAYNIDHLGLKAILKTTGKKTAKAMVKERHLEAGVGQAAAAEDGEQEEERKDEMK